MTETAHTPLPWTFEAGVEDNEGEFYVCHAGTVCTETTVCNPHSEADARFIVQAVNSHHRLVEALEPFAFVGEDGPKDTQAVWEMIYRDRVQDWFSYEDFERARDVLAALKEAGR